MQQPIFNATRERDNKLFYKSYKNDKGVFQFHSQIELYFIDEGEMEVWLNDKYRILRAGEMSVALSYDAHAYKTPESSRSSVLIIPPYMCEEFIAATKTKKSTNPFICDPETVKRIKYCYEQIKRDNINDIEKLVHEFGDRLTFFGCMDTYEVRIPNVPQEEVDRLTAERIDNICRGGCVFPLGNSTVPGLRDAVNKALAQREDFFRIEKNRVLP